MFDALQIGELSTGYDIALEADSEQKWKHLAEVAIQKCEFALAQECLYNAQDFAGLLLLATCSGDAAMMEKLADDSRKSGCFNVAFVAYYSLGTLLLLLLFSIIFIILQQTAIRVCWNSFLDSIFDHRCIMLTNFGGRLSFWIAIDFSLIQCTYFYISH